MVDYKTEKEKQLAKSLPVEKENIDIEESVDVVFDKISEIQKQITKKRISDIENSLRQLEDELTEIIDNL